jgi:dienelactone hydrolase
MKQFKRLYCLLPTALWNCGALAAGPLMRTDLAPPNPLVERNLPRYLESRAARFVGWLEDGSLLVATRFGETEQIHRVRAALGARDQQSFEAEGVLAAAAQPRHEAAFAYLAPRPNGGTALLLQAVTGQAPVVLTDGHFRDGAPVFAHDGQRLAFASNRGGGAAGATGRAREIDVLDTAAVVAAPAAGSDAATPPTSALRVIAGGSDFRWRVLDWSPDDQRLLLGRETTAAESAELELFTADVASGTLSPLELPHKAEGKGAATASVPLRAKLARFTADGRGLLLLRTGDAAGGDFLQLQRLDTGSAEPQALSLQATRDVELFDESPDGHFLAYTSNEGGGSHLTLVDQQHKLDLNPASVPSGVISSLKFDPSGKRLALTIESATSPRDVYVLEPETQQVTRWTQSELGPLAPAKLLTPALVRFPTWDRIDNQPRMLTAYTYRPSATTTVTPGTPAGPHPVLILLRTGGGTQYRPVFEPLAQFLANELGFVVVAPNVRGASGFGQAFGELARGDLRDDAVRDVGSLLVWIGQQHELDFNHIFVLGEGYGAYLALASLAQYGDRLQGGIAAFPSQVANLANLASIRRPLLLVHGRSDPDVPAYEVEQLAARLRTGGDTVQYLGAPDEGARFMRKSDRDAYYAAAADFLAQLTR